jgi:hypothetical protein
MYIAAREEDGFTFVPDWMTVVCRRLTVVEDLMFLREA